MVQTVEVQNLTHQSQFASKQRASETEGRSTFLQYLSFPFSGDVEIGISKTRKIKSSL